MFLMELVLAYVVLSCEEPEENHQPWTGDHFPATCLYPGSNPGHNSDKPVYYYPGLAAPLLFLLKLIRLSHDHHTQLKWLLAVGPGVLHT